MKFFEGLKSLIQTMNELDMQYIAALLGIIGAWLVAHGHSEGQNLITGSFALLQRKPQQQQQ